MYSCLETLDVCRGLPVPAAGSNLPGGVLPSQMDVVSGSVTNTLCARTVDWYVAIVLSTSASSAGLREPGMHTRINVDGLRSCSAIIQIGSSYRETASPPPNSLYFGPSLSTASPH